MQCLTINAMEHSPGGRFLGLWTDAIDFLRAIAQQENEDYSDQEAGQQQDGHDDDLLLVHTDLCKTGTDPGPHNHSACLRYSDLRVADMLFCAHLFVCQLRPLMARPR